MDFCAIKSSSQVKRELQGGGLESMGHSYWQQMKSLYQLGLSEKWQSIPVFFYPQPKKLSANSGVRATDSSEGAMFVNPDLM